ncbi:hypothetical protein [Bacillus sp. AFS018417]|nr:hypothetical protein [Bacillus sp. AFS018417]
MCVFCIGKNKKILGSWGILAGEEVKKNHFAFGVTLEPIVYV